MLLNIEGSKQTLLSKVVSSVLLYVAPVWVKAMKKAEYRKQLSSVYRLSALRTICGFRTISEDAAYANRLT